MSSAVSDSNARRRARTQPGAVFQPLVAFRREHAHLQQMIRDARAGRGSVAGIHGLPGSGKSFLLDSLVADATEFSIIRLPVPPDAGASLEPWRQLFQLAEDEERDAESSAGQSTDFGDLRQSAISAIHATCRQTAAPTLLVFDDCLPWQTRVAEAIASAVFDADLGVTVMMVVAWRDDLDGSTNAFRPLGFPIHRLHPFTQEQAADFLAKRIGVLPEPAVLAEIWRATGGNPSGMLFACSQLTDEHLDGLIPLPDPMPIGGDLAHAFGHWADSLESEERLAVTIAAAAAMPRPILQNALAEVELTTDALRPAMAVGALAIRGDRVEFVHPLCRPAVFQRSPSQWQLTARRAVSQAYRSANLPEPAAIQAVSSAPERSDEVATLCSQAAQAASQRSDHEAAARFEVLGARFAQTERQAAEHLIRASSLWQAAGRLEWASKSLRRITPVDVSTSVMGQVRYRAACIAFAAEASPRSPVEMAAGAEACAADEPRKAVTMLSDAAASAVLLDQPDDAMGFAQRAVELAGGEPGVRDMARVTRDAVATLASDDGTLADYDGQERMISLMGVSSTHVTPQLAYVLGSSLVQVATPAVIGRWLTWMNNLVETSGHRVLAAAVAMVRANAQIFTGHFEDAVASAQTAVLELTEVQDLPLLARALGWCTWAQACAGDVNQSFESASRFFSLEQAPIHSANVQVLASLAHCELQRGRPLGAQAWLSAAEEESATGGGTWRRTDWPSLPIFLQLALLAGYEPHKIDAEMAAGAGADQAPVILSQWTDGLRQPDAAVSLRLLDQTVPSGSSRPFLKAQITLTSALRQHQLGMTEVATFNFTQASKEFDHCGASGWSRLALMQLREPQRRSAEPSDAALVPAGHTPLVTPSRPGPSTVDATYPDEADPSEARPLPAAEIHLLGQFSVSQNGAPAAVPLGHAAQALKIVALFRRISVDELAEVLWPGAGPGVGTRRLRNILWRIKSSSGDLLARRDNFICLEHGVITDVAVFEEAAAKALKGDLGLESAHSLAREAIQAYGGELLPSDRYADWTTGPREALTQLRLQLLDLMLTHALREGNRQEAFSLLEDLIDADPYEERYYTQLATLHLEAGNRSRMRATVSRGERMLADLGVQPSQGFVELVRELQNQ